MHEAFYMALSVQNILVLTPGLLRNISFDEIFRRYTCNAPHIWHKHSSYWRLIWNVQEFEAKIEHNLPVVLQRMNIWLQMIKRWKSAVRSNSKMACAKNDLFLKQYQLQNDLSFLNSSIIACDCACWLCWTSFAWTVVAVAASVTVADLAAVWAMPAE